MLKEIIVTGSSVEEAIEKGLEQLNVTKDRCDIEILAEAKKSFFFGRIKEEAKVKMSVKESVKVSVTNPESPILKVEKENNNEAKLDSAVEYVTSILSKMQIEATIETTVNEDGAIITIVGENLGLLIGRHGETLDSLQYLTSLVCNRIEGSYFRITIDCGKYRDKREDALQELAKKISLKVKKSGRSQMLEPMNPYERRIIHAAVSEIDGVTSKSKGDEPNRRIIIISTSKSRPNYHKDSNTRKKPDYQKPTKQPQKPERTMEQILKGDADDTAKKTKLYSKVEL